MIVYIMGCEAGLVSQGCNARGAEASFEPQQDNWALTIFDFPPSFYLTCHLDLSCKSCLFCGQMTLDEGQSNKEGFGDISDPLHSFRGWRD